MSVTAVGRGKALACTFEVLGKKHVLLASIRSVLERTWNAECVTSSLRGNSRQGEVLLRDKNPELFFSYRTKLRESGKDSSFFIEKVTPLTSGRQANNCQALMGRIKTLAEEKGANRVTLETRANEAFAVYLNSVLRDQRVAVQTEERSKGLVRMSFDYRDRKREPAKATNGAIKKVSESTRQSVANQGRIVLDSANRGGSSAASAGRGNAKRGRDDRRTAVDPYSPYKRIDRRSRTETSDRSNRNGRDMGVRRNQFSAQPPSGPQTHRVTLKKKYIDQITHYGKTIEGRINSGMMLRFKVGDTVTFFAGRSSVTCDIVAIRKHLSFREMLEKEGVRRCLADVATVEEGAGIYDRIPNYTNRASQNGVLAIEIKVKR